MSLPGKYSPFAAITGKQEQQVVAVFGITPRHIDRAVRHVRRDAPLDVPVFLFASAEPFPESAVLCEKVIVDSDPLGLLVSTQKELWPYQVVFSVSTWTKEHGWWPVKLAPFLVPPFHAAFMNEHGGFLGPSDTRIWLHLWRRCRDGVRSSRYRIADLRRGAWLWILTILVTRWLGVARSIFRHRVGGAAVPLPLAAGQGETVACFRYHPTRWDRKALLRLAQATDVRWILFLQGDTEADARDLMPLFEDPRTFAVARQAEIRDWHDQLPVRAPFRRLAPGVASQTLAPFAPAMLVERAKLAGIGIPKTLVPASSWFLMHWRAAAGGWRSYTAGSAEEPRVCPDWPLEECEFHARALCDGWLRRLQPAEPDLARGSIRFRVGGARPLRGLPRVLVVSPYLPYPLSHGGAVRIYNLCRTLSDRVDFLLACFKEETDVPDFDKLHEVFREVYVVDIDEHASQDAELPAQVRGHNSPCMEALIRELVRAREVGVAQFEYTHMAHFRAAAAGVPAILVEHDLTFSLYRQLSEAAPTPDARREHERWLCFERHWLPVYEAVWTMSDDDCKAALAEGSRPAGTFVIPNGVDLERFAPCEESEGEPEVLFVGSFRHLPNILGFEFLRSEVMPRVWNCVPQARLRVIAGSEPRHYWAQLHQSGRYPDQTDPRIEIHEFVEDLRPLYAKARVVAVPLRVSAGTNIKVMEALACGRAIVTTTAGCYGLDLVDGREALICDTAEGFAEAIVELLTHADLRQELAGAGRRLAEQRFGWSAIGARASACYTALLSGGVMAEVAS